MDPLFEKRGHHPRAARAVRHGHGHMRRSFGGPRDLPGGHGRGAHHGGRSRRSRRGNLRLAVLALLTEHPMHGYEMIQELEKRTSGFWRPSPGSIYPILQMLEEEGLIASQDVEGRRRFTLSDAGRTEAESAVSAEKAPWDEVTGDIDPAYVKMRTAVGQIHTAAMQVAESGAEQDKEKAVEILKDARRKLYAILAEAD